MSTQLQQADSTAIEAIDQDNPDSIFNQPRFISATRPYTFTPQQVKSSLIDFSQTTDTLADVLDRHDVDRNTFYVLLGLYPEINDFYTRMRRIKADRYGEKQLKLVESLPVEEEMYMYDKDGNKSLTSAAANFIKTKIDTMHRLAQICETGSYIPVSKQENTNRTLSLRVNISGKLPPDFDLSNCDPTTLVSVLKGKR